MRKKDRKAVERAAYLLNAVKEFLHGNGGPSFDPAVDVDGKVTGIEELAAECEKASATLEGQFGIKAADGEASSRT